MAAREKLRRMRQAVVRNVTAFLLTVGLFLLYYAGLALTAVLMLVATPSRVFRSRKPRASYWSEAAGYTPDLDDARRQS